MYRNNKGQNRRAFQNPYSQKKTRRGNHIQCKISYIPLGLLNKFLPLCFFRFLFSHFIITQLFSLQVLHKPDITFHHHVELDLKSIIKSVVRSSGEAAWSATSTPPHPQSHSRRGFIFKHSNLSRHH